MKTSPILMLALAASFAAATFNAQSADAVAKVNGVTIPQSRVDLLLKNNAAQGQPDTPELRNRIREELITREVISQEALKKGLDKSPEVTTQLEIQKQIFLVNAYLQDYFKTHPVSEDTLKKEYERQKSLLGDKEYKARHILVKQENDAKQIIAQLKKGVSFEKIAAEKSEDQGSKGRGGDLDWSAPGRYVPPFGEALKKLKKGQLTDPPVQTQFGWHVIRLDDERAYKAPGFEEVKPQIQQNLQRQTLDKLIGDLRAKAKIE
ncbi:MAG: peptidylprolyl isomerase [Betaproteobacteria bacterium]|nr:peptidylprolyl isomerase [Betaproteobacteria bacterium]